MIDVENFLLEKGQRTEAALEGYIQRWTGVPPLLEEAMRYSLFAGGKRLRPALALGAAEMVCGDDSAALPAACALEMIHTYSLIHDDLPSMDDDDLRRGRPTLHKAYDEATAILAGDGLLTMAFDVMAEAGNLAALRELAQAAGVSGMAGGQFLDLQSEGSTIPLAALRHLHACKTGALIRGAVRIGAMLGGADAVRLDALTAYAENIGLAFQIADDILDVTGDESAIGKRIGSDAANGKNTYVSLLGLADAQSLAQDAKTQAIEALREFGPEGDGFRALARFIVDRKH